MFLHLYYSIRQHQHRLAEETSTANQVVIQKLSPKMPIILLSMSCTPMFNERTSLHLIETSAAFPVIIAILISYTRLIARNGRDDCKILIIESYRRPKSNLFISCYQYQTIRDRMLLAINKSHHKS